jgi:hypothetical protein
MFQNAVILLVALVESQAAMPSYLAGMVGGLTLVKKFGVNNTN